MGFQFEKFTATNTSFDAKVTIRKTGQFGFSRGAINCYKIDEYDFVVLYFDAQSRVVGLELKKEHIESAIEIKKSKVNTFVRGKNFCDCYHIDYSLSRRYALKRDQESGFLYFKVDEGESVEGDAEEQSE